MKGIVWVGDCTKKLEGVPGVKIGLYPKLGGAGGNVGLGAGVGAGLGAGLGEGLGVGCFGLALEEDPPELSLQPDDKRNKLNRNRKTKSMTSHLKKPLNTVFIFVKSILKL